MVEIGTKVGYIPGEAHALDQDAKTGLPAWQHGHKDHSGKITILSVEQLTKVIRTHHHQPERRKSLTHLKPQVVWDAVILECSPDGQKAKLSITNAPPDTIPFVTWEYDNVPKDETKTKGNSWHLLKE
jgi:hypothetical protein